MRNIKHIRTAFRCFTVLATLALMASCSQVKYVPEGKYLVKDVHIRHTNRELPKNELQSYIRDKENLTILGIWKFHLGLYNLSGADTSKWYNRWLKRIGEEPVLYDENQTAMSRELLEKYLQSKGYFMGKVVDTAIVRGKKKVRIEFALYPATRYRINKLSYRIEDDSIRPIVSADSLRTLLKKNRPFDSDLHNQERDRVTARLRNRGYYAFSKDYIYFKADSTIGNNLVNDTLVIMPPLTMAGNQPIHQGYHAKYKYRHVYYVISSNPQKALLSTEDPSVRFDTLMFQGAYFLYNNTIDVHPSVLAESSYIVPGELYNALNADRTRTLLSSLSTFRYIDIRYKNVPKPSLSDPYEYLDCYIQLIPSKKQSYSIQLEGTNSSGNLGAGGNIRFQHNNLFRGAELLDAGLSISEERQFVRGTKEKFNTFEVGAELKIEFPKFMVPFVSEGFRKRYIPRTSIQFAYNYQRRPDYTRTIANVRWGYNWRGSRYITHYLYPSEFNLIWLPTIHPDFQADIKNTFLQYSYENHFILNSNYSLVYNTQTRTKQPEYFWGRFNFELAGNLLNQLASLWESTSDDYNDILGIRFAQYTKGDVEIRYHHALDKFNSFAYRFFTGVAYPYGNLKVMPFEKTYFSGGANGIRAWPVRGLGPGSYRDTTSTFYNQTADIKLEANLEYRFKLIWLMEGAFFLDAGNIWSIREDASRDGGLFRLNEFYKQIAVGTGFGFRMDFDYFLFRIDVGVKAVDPTKPSGNRWVFGGETLKWREMTYNFAIGYPF
ncbi:MAG: BamA/TamA family outer membrane protein [Breznakibacter sp.]